MLQARYFLERNMFRVVSPCSLSLMTYALLLGKSDLSSIALDQLRNASTNEEGDFGWQNIPSSKDAPDWLYEEGAGRHRKEPIMSECMYMKFGSRYMFLQVVKV
jgi:hypothetical protein